MYEQMLEIPPFYLNKEEKKTLLNRELISLTKHHDKTCSAYHAMLTMQGCDCDKLSSYEEIPFLPVGLFKELELRSIEKKKIFKVMTSSGTTGQAVSKIYLDRETAGRQQKTLVKLVSEFTGKSRMPMLIIDCPSVIKNRAMFSARGAGILGFSIFGTKKIYALTDEMQIDWDNVKKFLEENQGKEILLFGFTFMIWQHFYKELKKRKEETKEILDLSHGVLIHGGGWKKLVSQAVSPQEFKDALKDVCGISRVYDYYGMVEQTGCIYMECEYGHLHASIFSDVIIRNPKDFSICSIGEKGIIQVLSVIPFSYPGHSLLTEDEGILLGEDDCPCGRKGKYFKVLGRLKNAEIRGCSDTYAADFLK